MVRCPPIMTALAATVTPGGNGGTAPPDEGIPNFRRVGRFQSLYRCGAPDGVADAIQRSPSSSGPDRDDDDPPPLTESERFLLHDVTLWIDLRFDREADTERCDAIMQHAPGGPFEKVAFDDPRGLESVIKTSWMANQRLYLHFERPLFSTESYIRHVTEYWVNREAMDRVASDMEAQQALIAEVIQERGLLGLYEVVLEHGPFITNVLQAITLHLEQQQQQQLQQSSNGAAADGGVDARILIHCTLGKDRTGLICMLCQVMMGDDEKDILQDFSRSECVRELAKEKMKHFMDGKITGMERCDEETMAATLNYLKVQYGSVNGYLDNIGFDQSWRERFVSVAA